MSVATQIERLQGIRNQIRNKMVSLGLSSEKDLLKKLADDLDKVANNGDATTVLSTSTRSKTLAAGYYSGGTISIPSNYYPLTSSNTTATAGTVLKDYKFVDTSGTTITGTIPTATSDNISGSIVAPNPTKITLNTDSTTGNKSATASASVSVTKGLYTGSSNISKALADQTYTASAEVTLASSVAGSSTIPDTLPAGTVEVTPTTTRTLYSDTSTTKGYLKSFVVSGIQTETKTVTPATTPQTITPTAGKFISSVAVNPMPSGAYSASVNTHNITNAKASSSVSGTITDITTTTAPTSGTDGTDYYTITPSLSKTDGKSETTAKATIGTAGYIAAGNTTSGTSSKTVGVTTSQGGNRYLNVITPTNAGTSDPGNSYINVDTIGRNTNNQFIKIDKGYNNAARKFTISGVPNGNYSASVSGHVITPATAKSSITGTITNIATSTAPTSGTDGTNYYTIVPSLNTTNGASAATAKATIDTSGYIAANNKTASDTKEVGVTSSQGKSYYINATTPANVGTSDPGNGYTNVATIGRNTNNQFIKIDKGYNNTARKFTISGVPNGAYSASATNTIITGKATSSVSGKITNIATTTAPSSGTDGTDYYSIIPSLSTTAGSSTVVAKATIGTAGYIATGDNTTTYNPASVPVDKSQGSTYYLKASTFGSETTTDPKTTVLKSVTAGISTKYIPVNSGYIKSGNITVNATPSQSKSATPSTSTQTISPDSGKLLSSVSISAIQTETKSVTPTTSAQTVTPTTGKFITSVAVSAIPNQKNADNVSASVSTSISNASINATHKTKGLTVTASSSGNVSVPLGYYSSAVSKSPSSSNSAIITPVLAGTNVDGAITITAGTSASTVTSEDNYNNGFITSVTVNPTPSSPKSATPTTSAQTITPDSGKLLSSVTVDAIPNQKDADSVTATVTASISDITSINASQVTNGVTVTASASGSTVVPVGYYSTKVSKTPSSSTSTTIKPKLAGTNGAIELTAGISTFTKTSTADYSNGFITSVKVNPTPSTALSVTPTTSPQSFSASDNKDRFFSSVKVDAIPSPYFDTSGVTATASDVLSDKKFINSSGKTVTGTIVSRGDASTTLSTSARSTTLSAGYYTGGTISVPDNYYPLTSSNTTATAGTVLKDYKFVNSSGTTVTGTIATITPANTGTTNPGGDYTNVATIGRNTNNQFIKIDKGYNNTARKFTISGTPDGAYSASVGFSGYSAALATSKITGTITNIATTTEPDSGNYYTITPDFESSSSGSATAYGTATIGTAGYIAKGSTSSGKSNKTIPIVTTKGSNYYLPYQSKSVTPTIAKQTVIPDSGKLLSSVTVNAVPSIKVTLRSDSWSSDSNTTIGKYFYNIMNDAITDSNNLFVMPSSPSTAQSFGVYAYAQDKASASTGILQFRSVAQPTSNLEYTIYYMND